MNTTPENMQKFANYKGQMGRLKKAINAGFYLEAVFIEYAVMEDRLESALRHGKKWSPNPDKHISIDRKLTLVDKMAEEKGSLAEKYFSPELTQGIREWKDRRNRLIHALLKQNLHTEDLQDITQEGQELVNTLRNKVQLFNRALERRSKKSE